MMTEFEYFQTFNQEYLADLEKLDQKEIHILEFAKKYNLLVSKNKVSAKVFNDLSTYKTYKNFIKNKQEFHL